MLMNTSSATVNGYFGQYGGQHVPEALLPELANIAQTFNALKDDPGFAAELEHLLKSYSGRPTPLFFAKNLTKQLGGAKIYLKREDLNHLGAHKINNTLGQVLLAKRMGKTRIIAETGAGQHGVAAAAAASLMGLECEVYMGEHDMQRQELNVFRMRMMGAKVTPALEGQRGLKEAVDKALLDWMENYENSFYSIGSAVGPHPFPLIVRTFQSIISKEAREQIIEEEGRLPDACIACVGGGSNCIGMFAEFIKDERVALIGVEPGGKGSALGEHAASISYGKPGILHGARSYMVQDASGEVGPVHSISAGLDYPGIGPEHAYLKDQGRADYVTVTDQEALDAFFVLSRAEGIIPALESSHALAHVMRIAPKMSKDAILVVSLSGRGDKDVDQILSMTEGKLK